MGELEVFDDRASDLRARDAYRLSGCAEEHHVVAVTESSRDDHVYLLVYLPSADRIADVRLRRERLIEIQRPRCPEAGMRHRW